MDTKYLERITFPTCTRLVLKSLPEQTRLLSTLTQYRIYLPHGLNYSWYLIRILYQVLCALISLNQLLWVKHKFQSSLLYIKKETTIGVVHPGKCCTRKSCPFSSLIWHTTLYQNPTITSPSGGEEPDAVNVSHTQLYFWFWQKSANAST